LMALLKWALLKALLKARLKALLKALSEAARQPTHEEIAAEMGLLAVLTRSTPSPRAHSPSHSGSALLQRGG